MPLNQLPSEVACSLPSGERSTSMSRSARSREGSPAAIAASLATLPALSACRINQRVAGYPVRSLIRIQCCPAGPHLTPAVSARLERGTQGAMTTEVPVEDHPTFGHATLLATYSAGVVLAGTYLGRRRRPLAMPGPSDLALLGLATFKLSRLMTRERVTRPLRAPFTEGEPAPEGDGVVEAPAGGQLRRAVGELLTCPFCASVWVGTAATLAFAAA